MMERQAEAMKMLPRVNVHARWYYTNPPKD